GVSLARARRPRRHGPGDTLDCSRRAPRAARRELRLTPHADLAAPGAEPAGHAHPNQFALLAQRRFAPFFWTQFLGAGNDNLFKFAFTVMITYKLQVSWMPASMAGLVIGALFILPFLLF